MEGLYLNVAIFIVGVFAVVSILISIINVFIWGRSYVNEVDFKWWPSLPGIIYDMPMPLFCLFLIPIGYLVGFLWLPAILCGIGYLGLYSLRGFVRFRKKVNKALENKTTENHTHEWGE